MKQAVSKFGALAVLVLTLFAATAGAQSEAGLPQCGEGTLLYRSPVSGKYEVVPLVHTDAVIDVRGLLAAATVTQRYENNSADAIEAVYVFPLPHDAAVYDMEIRIGDRVIRSLIRERAEAKRTYEAAKAEGKRAALLEQERPNIFTASVANIMPGDRIDVRLRYVEPLRWEQGKMRLTFPMVVGPRYIPGAQATGHRGTGWSKDTDAVPDASRITPPVRHPGSRSGHTISLAVELDTGFEAAAVKSVSHAVNVQRMEGGRQHVELAAGATLPNRDFILEVQQGDGAQPEVALFLSPDGSGETHFMLAAYPPSAPPRERMPVEMLYLIDVSGSMAGTSIEQAREALRGALERLLPQDRFAIVAFSSGFYEFAPQPLAATAENVAAAQRFVDRLEANGGTEMLPALQYMMRMRENERYLRNIVVLTDGDLGNEEQIFEALRQELSGARLYTVAIGSAPNHFLATKMAQFGRGTFTHIAVIGEVREQMLRLFESIESPVLTDVRLSFAGVEPAEVYPQRAPDLFMRQPLVMYGRIANGSAGRLHLTARTAGEPYEASFEFDASKASFHPGITTLWARQRVNELMDGWRRSEEKGRAEIRDSIVAHAVRYRLVTRFTSLVAVEEVIANAGGQNKTVAVPTELPASMQMEKVFGAPATGTADDFFKALGFALLLAGMALLYLRRKAGVTA